MVLQDQGGEATAERISLGRNPETPTPLQHLSVMKMAE